MRRVDVGQGTPARRTYFEVLPVGAIDFCGDCTPARRERMQATGRCVPSAAAIAAAPPGSVLGESSAVDCTGAQPCDDASTAEGARAAAASRERVARYRAKHPRFDWVPAAEALQVFERYRRQHPTMAASAVLDRLVMIAHKAIRMSGNG